LLIPKILKKLLHILKKYKVKLKDDTFKELGKFLLNLALALFVFAFIQPLAEESLNAITFTIGIILGIFVLSLGIYFINKSS